VLPVDQLYLMLLDISRNIYFGSFNGAINRSSKVKRNTVVLRHGGPRRGLRNDISGLLPICRLYVRTWWKRTTLHLISFTVQSITISAPKSAYGEKGVLDGFHQLKRPRWRDLLLVLPVDRLHLIQWWRRTSLYLMSFTGPVCRDRRSQLMANDVK